MIHGIGARELGLMKSTAVLVNAARGGVVDHDALVEALQQKQIFAAGLDVTEKVRLMFDIMALAFWSDARRGEHQHPGK